MAKIKKIITAKKHDPIYREGFTFSSFSHRYLYGKNIKERKSNVSNKETVNVKGK